MENNDFEKWLKKISNDISLEFHHKDLFERFNEIIKNNPDLGKMESAILIWMRDAFTEDLVIGIGRICDRDNRTDSLVRFLEELKKRPDYLTRERHKKFHKEPLPGRVSFGDMSFDKLAGVGQPTFSTEIITKDIKEIREEEPVAKILAYRNTYIAHSKRDKDEAPTYDELFEAYKIIEEIVKKYNHLVFGATYTSLTPTIQGNWQEVFTIPWIKNIDREVKVI